MHPAMQRRRHRLMIRRTTKRRSPRRGLATFFMVVVGVFVLFIGGSIAGTGAGLLAAYSYFSSGLPDPHIIDGIAMPASTYVYDRTGTQLLARFECENREEVTFSELPDSIVNATVAAEDRTFWTNDGIDYTAVARAALANLEAGAVVQGASTITQQVIKYAGSIKLEQASTEPIPSAGPSVELDPHPDEHAPDPCEQPDLTFLAGRGFGDKIREQILARQVTEAYPGRAGKERILETYLNLIYYGNQSYGIRAASANFFGQPDLTKLTLSQGAFLAGLPQLPSYYDPYQPVEAPRGPARAIARRNDVLDAMLHEGYITQAQHDEAVAVTWEQMNPSKMTSFLREPQFAFRVQHEVARILESMGVANPEQAVRTGGYRVTTTLDYPLQQVAKEQVAKWVSKVADKNVHNGALVAVDSATGEIVAYVGSVDYYNREDPRVQGQFDVAGLGRRQPGSAFKPITYSSAFRARQATPATFFLDAVTQYGSDLKTAYVPTNANIKEHGPVLAMDALRYSLNVPSVMMQYLVGVDVTAKFAQSMGIASSDYIMSQDPGLTLTLGSVPVNLTNMTQAYSVFAAKGTLHPATTVLEIRDRDGNVIYDLAKDGPKPTEPMTPAEAYLTHWILEGNTNPRTNVLWGPPSQLRDPSGVRRHAGLKTGTTNDFKDVSAFGYIPDSLTVGVWMGNNNQEPLSNKLGQGLYSADGPLYLWHDFMNLAINQAWDWNGKAPAPNNDFVQPPGVVMAPVCRFSGMSPTGACGPTITVPFLEGTVPPRDNVHVNKQGGFGAVSTPDADGNGGGFQLSGSCFDVVAEVAQDGRRPREMVAAAARWADRFVNGQLGPKGNPSQIGVLGPDRVWLLISPLRGNNGFGAPICGHVRATPTPDPSASGGGGGGGGCGPGKPGKCTPAPSSPPSAALLDGAPEQPVGLVAIFAVPALLGAVPMAARAARWGRRRLRRR